MIRAFHGERVECLGHRLAGAAGFGVKFNEQRAGSLSDEGVKLRGGNDLGRGHKVSFRRKDCSWKDLSECCGIVLRPV